MFVMLISIIYSSLMYFIPLICINNSILDMDGHNSSLWDSSVATYYSILITGTIIVMYDMRYFNLTCVLVLAFNILFILLIIILVEVINSQYMVSGILLDILDNIKFWLVLIVTSSFGLVPFFILRSCEFFFSNKVVNNINKGNYYRDFKQKKYEVELEEMYKYNRSVAKFKRIFNMKSNFKADNYADKKMLEIVKSYKESKIKNN